MAPKKGAKKGRAAKSSKKTVAQPTIDDHPMPLDEAILPAPVTVEDANTECAGPDTLNDVPRMADDMEQVEPSIEERATTAASTKQEEVREVVMAETVAESMGEEAAQVDDESRALSKSSDEKGHESRSLGEANKMTMEERKAKFNELRMKMVCPFFHDGPRVLTFFFFFP